MFSTSYRGISFCPLLAPQFELCCAYRGHGINAYFFRLRSILYIAGGVDILDTISLTDLTVAFVAKQPRIISEMLLAGMGSSLLPNAGKLELRLRGPNITPGYFRRDDLTREAFDEDGFYKTGDAGRFAVREDPSKGILFDGRVAEDFKLLTGSWVSTGMVRDAAISACSEIVQDAVVTGHDRDFIGLLVIPNIVGMAELAGGSATDSLQDFSRHAKVRQTLQKNLAAYNSRYPASSTRITRVLFLTEPLEIDAGEITDKGYVNQRAVLERRQHLVEKLYSSDAEVILIDV